MLGVESPWRRRSVVAACALSVFIVSVDTNTVNVALPSIRDEFDTPVTTVQLLVSAYTIALASFYLLSGTLGDRFGRRSVFTMGLAVFLVGSGLCAIASSFPALVSFRILQAIGAATLAPMAMAILSDEFTHPAQRARAIGVWAMAGGLGAGFGPVAGGLLVTWAGWRGIYWSTMPFAAVALLLSVIAVRESTVRKRSSLRLGSQALLAIALCGLLFATVHLGETGLDAAVLTAVVAIVAAVGLLVVTERRSDEPLISSQLFTRGPFSASLLAITGGFFLLGGVFFLATFYLQTRLGMSALATGLIMVAFSVGSVSTSRFVSVTARARRAGFYYALTAVAGCAGVVILAVADLADGFALAVALVLPGLCCVGIAFASANTSVSIFGLAQVDPEIMGRAAAFMSVARQFGQSMGVALTSIVFATAGSSSVGERIGPFVPAYLFLAVVTVLLISLVPLLLPPRRGLAAPVA